MNGGRIGDLPAGNGAQLYMACSVAGAALLALHLALCAILACCGRPTLLSLSGLSPNGEMEADEAEADPAEPAAGGAAVN